MLPKNSGKICVTFGLTFRWRDISTQSQWNINTRQRKKATEYHQKLKFALPFRLFSADFSPTKNIFKFVVQEISPCKIAFARAYACVLGSERMSITVHPVWPCNKFSILCIHNRSIHWWHHRMKRKCIINSGNIRFKHYFIRTYCVASWPSQSQVNATHSEDSDFRGRRALKKP